MVKKMDKKLYDDLDDFIFAADDVLGDLVRTEDTSPILKNLVKEKFKKRKDIAFLSQQSFSQITDLIFSIASEIIALKKDGGL